MEGFILFHIRCPRILLAMLIGAGLSLAGAGFQGLFGNPLVSPHILGVTSGASFGAALGILMSGNPAIVQLSALGFGFLAVLLVWSVSRFNPGARLFVLVLSGIIVGTLFSALLSLIKYIADPEEVLPDIVYWLMGSLAGSTYRELLVGAPMICTGIIVLLMVRWRLNILSLSEEEAESMGIHIGRLRVIIIAAATVITATAVSLCGVIGWIGLVIPHIGRMLVGSDHRKLLPACVSIGSFYLLLIDDLARSATNAEIPLSIISAVIGAPFFYYMLRKTGGRWK
jgi:iron complex transport system permease protein